MILEDRGIINVSRRRRIYFSVCNVCHCNSAKTQKEWKFILAKIGRYFLCHYGKFIFPHNIQKIKTYICWNWCKTGRGWKNVWKRAMGNEKGKRRKRCQQEWKLCYLLLTILFFSKHLKKIWSSSWWLMCNSWTIQLLLRPY